MCLRPYKVSRCQIGFFFIWCAVWNAVLHFSADKLRIRRQSKLMLHVQRGLEICIYAVQSCFTFVCPCFCSLSSSIVKEVGWGKCIYTTKSRGERGAQLRKVVPETMERRNSNFIQSNKKDVTCEKQKNSYMFQSYFWSENATGLPFILLYIELDRTDGYIYAKNYVFSINISMYY